ncbi:MAG: hypothetical protein ACUZ8H_16120 [Candidatus Anammoxibacter sp.]
MSEKETLEKIWGAVQEISSDQKVINVHLEQHRKEIDKVSELSDLNEKTIATLSQNQKFAMWLLTIGGTLGTGASAWIFNHFFKH